MHRKLFAFVFVAALLFSSMAVLSDSDSSDAAIDHTSVSGFLVLKGNDSSTPAVDFKVKLYSTSVSTAKEGITGSDGSFTVLLGDFASEQVLYMTVVAPGEEEENYVIFVGQGPMSKHTATEWILDLNGVTTADCELSSSPDCGILIGSGSTDYTVTVKGTTDKPLINAMVTLKDGTFERFGMTNATGLYKFTGIPFGDYELKITCNGYQTSTGSVSVDDTHTETSVTMTEKPVPTFYGMTTYHALLLLGVLVGLILVTISYFLVRRNWKGMKE